jgi:hypothetical protein
MTQIRITNLTGSTPIDIYVADVYGNSRSYIGQITGNTTTLAPPTIYEYPSSLFDYAPSIMLILSDSTGVEKFKILDGVSGCTFNVIFEISGCTTQLIIS